MKAAEWRKVRLAIWERDRGICGICGEPIPPDAYHVDHIIARSCGGSDDPPNLRATHGRCNQRKSYLPGPRTTPRPYQHRPGRFRLHLYLPNWMRQPLKDAARKRRYRGVQTLLEVIIEECLAKHGHFPPSDQERS